MKKEEAMDQKLVTVAGRDICYIGKYDCDQYWMVRLSSTCDHTMSTQELFDISPYEKFRSKEGCEEYVKRQVLKTCKRILKEQGE